MSDDFFAEIDAALAGHAEASRTSRQRDDKNREFSHAAIGTMLPLAKNYKARLRERGIHAEIQGGERGFSFKMIWADAGHWTLEVYPSLGSNLLQFHTTFTKEDGREARMTDGATYDEQSWRDNMFKEKLEKAITDFIFYRTAMVARRLATASTVPVAVRRAKQAPRREADGNTHRS